MKLALFFCAFTLVFLIYEANGCTPVKPKGYCVEPNKCGGPRGIRGACKKWCGNYKFVCVQKDCYCYLAGKDTLKDLLDTIEDDLDDDDDSQK